MMVIFPHDEKTRICLVIRCLLVVSESSDTKRSPKAALRSALL